MKNLPLFCTLLFTAACPLVHAAPLTLQQAVQQALAASPQIREARAEKKSALILADNDKPVGRTHFSLVARGGLQGPHRNLPLNSPDNVVLPRTQGSIGLVMQQTIYHAGRRAAWQRYQAEIAQAQYHFVQAQNKTAEQTANAYIDVLKARQGVVLAKQGVQAAEQFAKLVQQQIAGGTGKPVDAYTALTQKTEAQDGLLKAESGLSLAQMHLNQLLGRPLNAPLELTDDTTEAAVPASVEQAVALAQKCRPELLALKARLQQAEAETQLARMEDRPQLLLRGDLREQTPTALRPENYAALMLEVRWPFEDGGKARRDTLAAEEGVKGLRAALQDAESNIALEIQNDWVQLGEAHSRIALQQVRLNAALQQETVALTAYRVGQGSALEEKAAASEALSSRIALLRAQFASMRASITLLFAEGKGLASDH